MCGPTCLYAHTHVYTSAHSHIQLHTQTHTHTIHSAVTQFFNVLQITDNLEPEAHPLSWNSQPSAGERLNRSSVGLDVAWQVFVKTRCEHRGKSKSSAWGLVKASWRRRHCSWYLKGEVECFQPQIIINKTTIILIIYLALFYLICVNELIKLSRALSSTISWEPLCPFSK